jgi:hypothetical protein
MWNCETKNKVRNSFLEYIKCTKDQQKHFYGVILYGDHQQVWATHVATCRVVNAKVQGYKYIYIYSVLRSLYS